MKFENFVYDFFEEKLKKTIFPFVCALALSKIRAVKFNDELEDYIWADSDREVRFCQRSIFYEIYSQYGYIIEGGYRLPYLAAKSYLFIMKYKMGIIEFK